jgi:hypothetical protein
MALVDQIDKLACGAGDALGTGNKRVPSIGIEYQLLNLHQKDKFTDIDSLETVRTAQQKGKAVIINIDRLSLVPQEVSIDTTEEAVKDC